MYENIKLGVSPLTKTVYAGRLNKRGDMWLHKTDVTEQFISCCLEYFEVGTENTISINGTPTVKITVKNI